MKKKWKVRNDLVVGQQYGVSTFASGMAKFRGKEVTLNDEITFEIEEVVKLLFIQKIPLLWMIQSEVKI